MAGGGIKINNIKVSGGADGKTPIFKIENGKLYNSYANGKDGSWVELGQVKGNDGVDGKDGLAGAKLLSQELIGQDEQGGNIYKQTFSDGTEAYFTAPKGQDANPAEKGTFVIVGGEAQNTWDADTKLDKYTEVSNTDRYYGVDGNGNQYVGYVMKEPTYVTAGYLATYFSKTKAGDIIGGGGRAVLLTDTPEKPYQAANKLYVDDGLSGKLDKYTEASGMRRLYGVKPDGNQYIAYVMENPSQVLPGWVATYRSVNDVTSDVDETVTNPGRLITGSPVYPSHAANKKYVDDGLNNKVDKVTTAFKIYGTDGSGNQKVYPTGWSASSGLFQIMDQTPNGGYNDDGSFNSNINGTYMVAIPKKPSHATPKKWVEDNFTVYKHLIQLDMGEGSPPHIFNVLSTRSTPYTNASELPKNEIFTVVDGAFEQVQFVEIYNDNYVSGIEYNHNLTMWKYIDGTASGFFTIASDTVVKA